MKKRRKNKGGLLPNSRWAAYAAAATASTFGTAVAEAEIHYSGTIEQKIAGFGGASAKFPLSNGASIRLYNYSHRIPSYSTAGFSILGAAVSHSFRAKYDPPFFDVGASRLHSGQLVSQGTSDKPTPARPKGISTAFTVGVTGSPGAGDLLASSSTPGRGRSTVGFGSRWRLDSTSG